MQDKGIKQVIIYFNIIFIIKPQEAQYTQRQCLYGGATHEYAPIQGGTLRIFRWGCATETLEPLAYTTASSILLPYTRVNSPNSPYPGAAVFQKLLRSLAQSS